MKSKTMAIALVAALGTPLVLANPSMADRNDRGGATSTSSRVNLEAEARVNSANVRAESEVEIRQGTVNGIVKTKLSGEVEIVLANPAAAPVAAAIDATINIGTTVCTFTNDPRVTGPVTVGGQTLYKIEFQGSVSKSGTDPLVVKGLDCGGSIPAVANGDTATTLVTGLPTAVTFPVAKFVND